MPSILRLLFVLIPLAACATARPPEQPMNNEIFTAIAAKDVSRIQALLAADPALGHLRSPNGFTPLLAAAFISDGEGFAAVAKNPVLGAVRAVVAPSDLFEASLLGDADQMESLQAANPEAIHAWHSIGWTALHFAAFGGSVPAVQWLLSHGAERDAVAKSKFRNTPLQAALLTRSVDTARALVLAGADVRHVQAEGFTVLHEAAQVGDLALLRLLLERGANPTARGDDGRTPISVAEKAGHSEAVQLLQAAAKR